MKFPRLDVRTFIYAVIGLGMLGAVMAVPAIYFLGNALSPPPPVPVTTPVPPLLRAAFWARAIGAGDPKVEPITSWSLFSFITCNVVADVTADGRRNQPGHDRCTERQPGIVLTDQVTRNHVEANGIGQSHRTPFVRVATMMRLSREWDADMLLNTMAAQSGFGHDWRGIDQASTGYFGRAPGELTAHQAALLATRVQPAIGPDPWCDAERAKATRNEILQRMKNNGALDDIAFNNAVSAPLDLKAGACRNALRSAP